MNNDTEPIGISTRKGIDPAEQVVEEQSTYREKRIAQRNG